MKNNNKCCIGILKWQLFWEKEKVLKRQLLWDRGSSRSTDPLFQYIK